MPHLQLTGYQQAFVEAIAGLVVLTPVAQHYIVNHLRVRRSTNRELLLSKDHSVGGIFFLQSGLVRGIYIDARNQETTTWFVSDAEFIPSVYTMPDHTPAMEAVELLEESTLIWLNRDDLIKLYACCPETIVLEHRLAQLHLTRLTEDLRAFRQYSGRMLYKWFLESYPRLTNRIKDKHLASFLGVTPQSLSRIRSFRK
ncbi:MAG: hypothetical protein KKG00_00145 [Bacteroidetes bacterium]|nr:hypothetical protein [Bacteroidota bacterium]